MGRRTALHMVLLDDALEALALRDADDIDELALMECRDRDDIAGLDVRGLSEANLAEFAGSIGQPGFLCVIELGLAGILGFFLEKPSCTAL